MEFIRASYVWLHTFAQGDLNENANFEKGELAMHGYTIYMNYEDDLNKNDNFNGRNQS